MIYQAERKGGRFSIIGKAPPQYFSTKSLNSSTLQQPTRVGEAVCKRQPLLSDYPLEIDFQIVDNQVIIP